MMRFCTVINCMDGRVQVPVIAYMQKRFDAPYVDTITEAGPNRILAERDDPTTVKSILRRLDLSVRNHQPAGIAVAGHHDCLGNPAQKNQQMIHTEKAVEFLRQRHDYIDIVGLWVDECWTVHEVA